MHLASSHFLKNRERKIRPGISDSAHALSHAAEYGNELRQGTVTPGVRAVVHLASSHFLKNREEKNTAWYQ